MLLEAERCRLRTAFKGVTFVAVLISILTIRKNDFGLAFSAGGDDAFMANPAPDLSLRTFALLGDASRQTDCADAIETLDVHQLVRIRDSSGGSFFQATLDESVDRYVSTAVNKFRTWDVHVAEVLDFILDETPCRPTGGTRKRGVVVDVGANIGYFSSHAASRGCDTHAFEPQDATANSVFVSACINGWAAERHFARGGGRLEVYQAPVSPHVTLSFPKVGATGNVGGVSADFCRHNPAGCEHERTMQLDELFAQLLPQHDKGARDKSGRRYARGDAPIVIMKTDIEGFDVEALETAKLLIAAHAVANIVLELTPGGGNVASTGADGTKLGVAHNTRALVYLQQQGYTLAMLPFQHEDMALRTQPCQAVRIEDVAELVARCARRACSGLDGERRWHTDVWASLDPDAHVRYNMARERAFIRRA